MDRFERPIARFRRSLWHLLWLRTSTQALAVSLWVCGVVVLVCRSLGSWSAEIASTGTASFWHPGWVFLALPPVVVVCGIAARRRVPAAGTLRAVLDQANQADGLLMADGETALGPWRDHLESLSLAAPKLTWDFKNRLGLLTVAAVFAALSLAVPDHWLQAGLASTSRLDVAAEVQRLEAKLEILEDLSVLSNGDAEAIEDDLTTLQQNAEGNDPAKTLESLDYVENRLDTLALEKGAELADAAQNTRNLSAAAQAMNQAASKMDPSSLQKSMEALARATQKALQTAPESESKKWAESLCKAGLSPDQLDALSNALSAAGADAQKLLDQLANAGMLDLEGIPLDCQGLSPEEVQWLAGELCECEGGLCDGDLAALLCQCGCCLKPGDCFGCRGGCCPGQNGISRGPGATALRFDGETDEQGAAFKNHVLLPGGLRPEKGSVVQSVQRGAPTGTETSERSTGGGLQAAAQTAGAHGRLVLPRHRKVIRDYFNRASQNSKEKP